MDGKWQMKILRSSRKTISLEITRDGSVLVRAPYRMPMTRIQKFAEEKADWIERHRELMRERNEAVRPEERLSKEEIRQLASQALTVIPVRAEYYARKLEVTYGRITIRSQKTRWGSCSSKGNLNFNCLLMLTPPEVIDYVVVHELCHLREMNHSKRFWKEVEQILPDYRKQRQWLKENGGKLIDRLQP